jgi:hypothetical protein
VLLRINNIICLNSGKIIVIIIIIIIIIIITTTTTIIIQIISFKISLNE